MRDGRDFAELELAWLQRFGEPLPLRTDRELIETILLGARSLAATQANGGSSTSES